MERRTERGMAASSLTHHQPGNGERKYFQLFETVMLKHTKMMGGPIIDLNHYQTSTMMAQIVVLYKKFKKKTFPYGNHEVADYLILGDTKNCNITGSMFCKKYLLLLTWTG